jgi:hypothetical protein
MSDRPDRTPTVFETLAWLYAPATRPTDCAIVEADHRWRPSRGSSTDKRWAIWGRPASRHAPFADLVRHAIDRERGLRALRGRLADGVRVWDVERLPPVGRPGRWRRPVRFGLMSGAIARLGREDPGTRVADVLAEQAGGRSGDVVVLRPSGDGSALTSIRTGDVDVQLRMATVGGRKDPRRNAAALAHLGRFDVPLVPRLVSTAQTLGVGWSTESQLPGRSQRNLTRDLLADLTTWGAALPRDDGPAVAAHERLAILADAFPSWAPELAAIGERLRPVTMTTRGVVQHGDLWIGNVLARGGRCSGVIDWDTWHPAGLPGSDLLHLVAMERRRRTGGDLGDLWLERPWDRSDFLDATDRYWVATGLRPCPEVRWAIGIDWWTAQAAAALRRGRRPTDDPTWVRRNVDRVVAAMATSGRLQPARLATAPNP